MLKSLGLLQKLEVTNGIADCVYRNNALVGRSTSIMLLEVILGVNMGYCVPHCAGLYYGEQGRGGIHLNLPESGPPWNLCEVWEKD